MRIDRLHLENFRKYDASDFSFHPQFNLVVGENGAGKTSLLEALAVAIGSWLLGIRGYDSRHIQKRDIRRTTQFLGKKFVFREHAPVKVEAWGAVGDATQLHWSRELGSSDKRSRTTRKDAGTIRNLAKTFADLADVGGGMILPLISYYGADRLWNLPSDEDRDAPLKTPQDFLEAREGGVVEEFSERFVGYRNSVNSRTDLLALLRWMAYERRTEIDEEDKSPYLRAVLKAIRSCLPDPIKSVRFSIRQETLMFDCGEDRIIPMSDMSDGYRTMVAIIGDIACKAALLNPHLEDNAISETPGVVLIDELDQHLHPRWQRRIIEDLRRTFPKIQFICTTHSPFLIQSLRSGEELIVLDGQTIANLDNKSINDVAQGIMGVSNPLVSQRYEAMRGAAKYYLETLEEAKTSPEEKLEAYKERLSRALDVFSDNPGVQAFLEMKRAAALRE